MSLFAGILDTKDLNIALTAFQGPVVQDAINTVLAQYVPERDQSAALFVQGEITAPTARFRDGGSDEGQELGIDGRPLETHVENFYDIGFGLKRVGWALGWNTEEAAAMTVADLDRETSAKLNGNARRHTKEILKALMRSQNYVYGDAIAGNVTVRRLANTDGTLYGYPGAEDNHYLVTGYAAASMSATNNPFALLASEVREHYSTTTRIIAFINSAQRQQVLTLLPSFVDQPVAGIRPGVAVDTPLDPGLNVPGEFIGTDGASGVFVYVWDRVPAGYVLGGTPDQPAPLKRRVPQFATLQGFKVVAEEEHLPFYKRTWLERFGYAVAARLTWVSIQITTNGAYTDPVIV